MKLTEIWYKAYSIYTDGGRTDGARYNDMQRYLLSQVKAGSITMTDKCKIAHDVMGTAGL